MDFNKEEISEMIQDFIRRCGEPAVKELMKDVLLLIEEQDQAIKMLEIGTKVLEIERAEMIEHIANFVPMKVDKIICQGPATIVFWIDGTKTVVKKNDSEKDDRYAAFCAAFAKKMYGGNSAVKNIVDRNVVPKK